MIPTNKPLLRLEEPDIIYRTEPEKFDAIVDGRHRAKQARGPAGARRHDLDREVGAAVDDAAAGAGIKHVVLNAKYHAQEAEIVAQAGRRGTVTIATNMAGRGTDILLGGNPEFMARQQMHRPDELAERLPKGQERFVDDEENVYFFHIEAFYRVRTKGLGADLRAFQEADRRRARGGRPGSAACTSSAPSATRRGASTTSCAAAPAARATRARRASTCRSKTT